LPVQGAKADALCAALASFDVEVRERRGPDPHNWGKSVRGELLLSVPAANPVSAGQPINQS